MSLRLLLTVLLIALAVPLPGQAVPEADHILIECSLLRLAINDYSVRHQIKVIATVSASDESSLASVPMSLMEVISPAGQRVTLGCYSQIHTPKRFKAANTRIMFRAVGDSSGSDEANVPKGFFTEPGPYRIILNIRGEQITGEATFGEPLTMEIRQQGIPVSHFVLRDEADMDLFTAPQEFGPVYYKQQDMSNFVFQLANIENSLETGEFHTPIESPRYLFQVKIGDGEGGPTRLLDPSRYIEGYSSHMIRSEQTSTPLHFSSAEFMPGEVVVVDFRREDTLEPDSVFSGGTASLSNNCTVTERVMYALYVETAPTDKELGRISEAEADSAGQ